MDYYLDLFFLEYSIENSILTPIESLAENILGLGNDFILESRAFNKRDEFD